MARILIVGGGCDGRRLAGELVRRGYAVRITTRRQERRAEIEAQGAQCWIGTPDRLETLRGALDGVTVACWLLACVRAEHARLEELHGPRLEGFMRQLIDTTVRGVLYDASCGELPAALAQRGAAIVNELAVLNAIPARVLCAGTAAQQGAASWQRAALHAVGALTGDPA